MTLRGIFLLVTAGALVLAGGLLAGTAATTNTPDFKEVYDLLRTHLPGATEDSLNQAAVAGLIEQLHGRAALVGDTAGTTNPAPVKAMVLDQAVVDLRVSRITDTLADSLREASQSVTVSNKPAGTILDLRFTTGNAYATVKETVALLAPPKTPLIVLVNGATSGAAELLAAELRDAGALILGNTTAGLAMMTEDFPLADGERLRLATIPVKLHGTELARLQPDISVPVGLEEERALMENPYAPAAKADPSAEEGTNNLAPLLDHTTEADLVRQRRKDRGEDDSSAEVEPAAKPEPPRPVLRDPVLARALDLAKGLAVLRESRP